MKIKKEDRQILTSGKVMFRESDPSGQHRKTRRFMVLIVSSNIAIIFHNISKSEQIIVTKKTVPKINSGTVFIRLKPPDPGS